MAYLGKYPKFYPKYLWALIAITLIHACGVKKNIPQNRYLLKRNSVVVPKKTVSASEIKEQILHNPNKRVLFNKLPVFLWAYSLGTSLKHPELNDSIAWRKKLRNKLGEPPVLVDTALAAVSAENISNHLFNLGYFDNRVSYILTIGKHKAEVDYIVEPGKAYRLNSFFREPADTALKPLIDTLVSQNQAYRLWWPVNLNALNDAKDELAIELRDRGYYDASPDLFRYEIDTLADKKEGAVFLKLNNPLNQTKFQRYKFGATYLNIICSDIYLENQWPQSYSSKGKHFQLNHYPIKGNIMEQVVSIDSGNWFSQSVTNQTYVALVEMGLFSYVDLHQEVDTTNHLIITKIEAKAIPRIYTQIEPQALYSPQGSSGTNFQTQSQRSFGLAGIVSLNNRNAMGNGESLKISSVTSYEAIFKRGDNNNIRYGLQQGFNARLSLPNFSLLDKIKVKNSYQRKNTVFSLSYQFENNPNFKRSSLPASISLQYTRPNLSWYYTPVELSFNRNAISAAFLPTLPKLDQDFVKRVFTDQIITAAKFGGLYTNNKNKPGQTYFFGRFGFETSGNLHRLLRYMFQENYNPDSSYQFLGVNYFQYAKIESEIRIKRTIDELNSIAFRANFGMAIPYWNSSVIPYDKRYFIGGSNSLRGWRPRGIGPGNTPKSSGSIIDRSGELLLEANLEYRFTLVKNFIESAIFLDAGNIWNLSKEGSANGYGVIQRATFLPEVALNTGIGFRFDLSLFLFRIDLGLPIRDPSKDFEKRWVMTKNATGNFSNYMRNESAVCIGIGYPF
jgi:outer membrane protein assembly factor BamA